MSFFGGTNTLGASSTPVKPGGLFSSFGQAAAPTTSAPVFGASAGFGTSGFGSFGATSTTKAPAFGGFGSTTTAATPAFGGFGAASTTPTPNFGGFGTATTTAAPSFGGFGTTSTAAAPAFGGFGATAPTTNAQLSFGGLGGIPSSAPSAFGGFKLSANSTAPPAFGSFGSTPASTAPPAFGSFGAATTANAPSSFGGFGMQSNAPAFGQFGTATTTTVPSFGGTFGSNQPTLFGANATGTNAFSGGTGGLFGQSNFGKPNLSTATPGFGAFGGPTNFMLGQPQQPAVQLSPDEAFAQAILNVSIFGDERDNIIAKWNYLQAMWGTGKMFYSQSAAPVEITPENPLCRFKAIGFSRIPGKDNKLGLVALNFSKTLAEVRNQEHQIIRSLHSLFNYKPNILVHIDSRKEIEDKKCQLVIYVEEKSQVAPNESKRILATSVANYFNQANVTPRLGLLGIHEVLALVQPDEDQLKEYFENPPKGVDPRMWRQANLDNPDPKKFIPVPMIGFSDLKWRLKCQENETETHSLYLKKVEKDLAEIRQKHASGTAKISEYKRKLAELSHRVLKIIVKQECTRKVGLPLTPDEEALRTKLENMQAMVSAPTQFRGRLSELLSQMRMQRNQFTAINANEFTLDKDSEDEMKIFLSMQQKAMEVLADTVSKDLKALDIIVQGLPELRAG